MQAAKQVFDPHSCQGTIFHVSAFPEHVFLDCCAFVYRCVHSTLGNARESSLESIPFFLLVCMFSFDQPHTQKFSMPSPNFFFTAYRKSDSCSPYGKEPLNTLVSFWASCLSQATWFTATVALLAASTVFFLEVINTGGMLGQKLQGYQKLRSSKMELLRNSKMELLQKLHFGASAPPT